MLQDKGASEPRAGQPLVPLIKVPLKGKIGSSAKWESAWIDLDEPSDLKRGDRLVLTLGAPKGIRWLPRKVLVRLLQRGQNAGTSLGVITPSGVSVPESGMLEVNLLENISSVVQISIHGGENPWGEFFLGENFGPVRLASVQLCKRNE